MCFVVFLMMLFCCLQYGFTAIMRAAAGGHYDIVTLLLDGRANLTAQDIVRLH